MQGVNPYPTVLDSGSHEIHANKPQAISMFRASPWVSYQPTSQSQPPDSNQMDQDVDMDAPQISTLREEESPPPPAKASATGRKGKASHKPLMWPRPRRKEVQTDEEFDEVDDEPEEDQLIDDDDELTRPLPASALPNSARSGDTSKRKATTKRKPRKSDKKPMDEEKKAQGKGLSNSDTGGLAPAVTWVEVTPSEHPDGAVHNDLGQTSASAPVGSDVGRSGTPKKTQKKPAAPRPKNLSTKLKTVVPLLADDTGVMSEGYTGTAASSPAPFEANTPEPEPEPLGSLASAALTEETNLENVPLPQYPLPTKPFPVQNPNKMTTGFAPVVPLDKSGKKVRHWRVAQREIRGIAGGRWFARSWVGEKDSEYAASQPKSGEEKVSGVTLPRLVSTSASAPVIGRGSGKAKSKAISSVVASAAPSRSGSSIPEIPPTNARPPTKMRTILAPPSEGGDSDMAIPPES